MTREQKIEFEKKSKDMHCDFVELTLDEMLMEAEEDKKQGLLFSIEEVNDLFEIEVL